MEINEINGEFGLFIDSKGNVWKKTEGEIDPEGPEDFFTLLGCIHIKNDDYLGQYVDYVSWGPDAILPNEESKELKRLEYEFIKEIYGGKYPDGFKYD